MVCGHCGATEGLSVIQEFSNSSSLSQAISLENTPPEIRKELEKALSRKSNKISTSVDIFKIQYHLTHHRQRHFDQFEA